MEGAGRAQHLSAPVRDAKDKQSERILSEPKELLKHTTVASIVIHYVLLFQVLLDLGARKKMQP